MRDSKERLRDMLETIAAIERHLHQHRLGRPKRIHHRDQVSRRTAPAALERTSMKPVGKTLHDQQAEAAKLDAAIAANLKELGYGE